MDSVRVSFGRLELGQGQGNEREWRIFRGDHLGTEEENVRGGRGKQLHVARGWTEEEAVMSLVFHVQTLQNPCPPRHETRRREWRDLEQTRDERACRGISRVTAEDMRDMT